jgi:hypothetical protein
VRYFSFCFDVSSLYFLLFTSVFPCQILYDSDNKVIGIGTNDMGISKDGSKKENFQRGVEVKGFILYISLSRTYVNVLCLGSWSKEVFLINACLAAPAT